MDKADTPKGAALNKIREALYAIRVHMTRDDALLTITEFLADIVFKSIGPTSESRDARFQGECWIKLLEAVAQTQSLYPKPEGGVDVLTSARDIMFTATGCLATSVFQRTAIVLIGEDD